MSATSLMQNIRYHMPRIRPMDSVVGAGLGALGGLGVAGVRDAMGDDEEKDNSRYWTHGLAGAVGGFGLGNLVGDRARRYVANNVAPFGYAGRYAGSEDYATASREAGVQAKDPLNTTQADFLRPRSWAHFYNTAIADKPSQATRDFLTHDKGPNLTEFATDARQELLRRHMDLPVRPENALFKSTGRRWFQPTTSHTGDVRSGGIPGNREHVELAPGTLERYKDKGLGMYLDRTEAHITTPKELPETTTKQVYDTREKTRWTGYPWNRKKETYTVPETEPRTVTEHVGMKPNPAHAKLKGDPWSGVFARHGTQLDHENKTGRVFDHWDFGLQPLENALLKEYMTGGANLDDTVPYSVRSDWNKQQIADWFGGGKGQDDPTKRDHMMGMLKRVILNDVLGSGGVVFDQEFDFSTPGKPKPIPFRQGQTDVGLKYLP